MCLMLLNLRMENAFSETYISNIILYRKYLSMNIFGKTLIQRNRNFNFNKSPEKTYILHYYSLRDLKKKHKCFISRALSVPVSDYTFNDCKLMSGARARNIPQAAQIVEIDAHRKVLGFVYCQQSIIYIHHQFTKIPMFLLSGCKHLRLNRHLSPKESELIANC